MKLDILDIPGYFYFSPLHAYHNAQLFDNFESTIDAIKPNIVFDNKHNENIKSMVSTSNDHMDTINTQQNCKVYI